MLEPTVTAERSPTTYTPTQRSHVPVRQRAVHPSRPVGGPTKGRPCQYGRYRFVTLSPSPKARPTLVLRRDLPCDGSRRGETEGPHAFSPDHPRLSRKASSLSSGRQPFDGARSPISRETLAKLYRAAHWVMRVPRSERKKAATRGGRQFVPSVGRNLRGLDESIREAEPAETCRILPAESGGSLGPGRHPLDPGLTVRLIAYSARLLACAVGPCGETWQTVSSETRPHLMARWAVGHGAKVHALKDFFRQLRQRMSLPLKLQHVVDDCQFFRLA